MHLDLTRLRDGRLHEEFSIPPDDPILNGYGADLGEPLRLEIDLTHPSHGTYVMTAELHGTACEPCRRCLKPVEVEVSDRFRVVYRESRERDSEDEDLVAIEPGADRIDIGREVRDRLFLETDWYPLCREGCKGLCPVCGRNRNETECDCVESEPDFRWQALEELRGSG